MKSWLPGPQVFSQRLNQPWKKTLNPLDYQFPLFWRFGSLNDLITTNSTTADCIPFCITFSVFFDWIFLLNMAGVRCTGIAYSLECCQRGVLIILEYT
jgi:hypothetical protein